MYEPWKVYPPEHTYGSLDALLKTEIGVDEAENVKVVNMRAVTPKLFLIMER